MTQTVPQDHGSVVCEPSLADWLELARRNDEGLGAHEVLLGELPLPELRRAARREVLDAAVQHMQRWGESATGSGGGPLIVTGHQPVFPHPGIWAKRVALQAVSEQDAVCLNLIVDSDESGLLEVPVPRGEGRLQTVWRRLGVSAGQPFESAPVPTADQWARFVGQLEEDVGTLSEPRLTERLEPLAEAARRARDRAESLGEFMALVCRLLEGSDGDGPGFLELPVSRLSETTAFRRFLVWIVLDSERFLVRHNRALDALRQAARIRSSAHPLPNLRRHGQRCELPLWALVEGRRETVSAEPVGAEVVIATADRELCRVPTRDPDAALQAVDTTSLRPRGVALTLFARLCLADLFIHGIGGSRYERGTDAVIREHLGIEPPAFAVVSATFHLLPARAHDIRSERRFLQRRLQDLQHSPERFMHPDEPAVRAKLEQKRSLLSALEQNRMSKPERRAAYQQIRAITDALAATHAAETSAIERRLAELAAAEAEQQAASFREYPAFLFDREMIRAAVRRQCGVGP